MADKVTSPVVVMGIPGPQLTPPKKVSKTKKPRAKSTHPRTAEMVNSAIAILKERGGSSLQAIKKYIANTYKVDPEKHAPFIKKYLKAAVVSGSLVQTKGKGAAGSFKLSVKTEGAKTKIINKPTTGSKKVVVKTPSPAKKVAATKPAPKKAPTAEKRNVAKKPTAKPSKAKTTKPKSVAAPPKKAQPKKRPTVTKVKKPVPKKVTSLKRK